MSSSSLITRTTDAAVEADSYSTTASDPLLTESIISLVDRHLPEHVIQWHREDALWSFSLFFPRVELKLSLKKDRSLKSEIVDTYLKIARTLIDPLRVKVRSVLEPISTEEGRNASHTDVSATLSQVLELVAEFERREDTETIRTARRKGGWATNDADLSWDYILGSTGGLDLSSVKDTAFHILGKTPEQLCAGIPSEFRVLHVESILRPDLARAFLEKQGEIEVRVNSLPTSMLRKTLPPHSQLNHSLSSVRRDDLISDMCKPRITYHGTPLQNVASIVRNGFRMPGSLVDGKVVASPRSGIIYNRGIYSSQEPFYALSYAQGQMQKTPLGEVPSMRLFICATVMGRTYRGGAVHGPLQEGYDAHFDGGFEYIVHDKRAILPCYVVHLDLGAEAAQRALREAQENPYIFEEQQRKWKQHHKLDRERLAPGDLQRQKEAKKAAAMKWFPYGFGPASGTRFVIEEVGEVSDDEEEYGDWQEARHEFVRKEEDGYDVGAYQPYHGRDGDEDKDEWKGGPMLDQYQSARKAKAMR